MNDLISKCQGVIGTCISPLLVE